MDHLGKPTRRDLLAVLLVSAGWLLYQITLTRVLSVVVWYHFAFLAVALAMLGAAAPGVWFAARGRPSDRNLTGFLVAAGVLPAVSIAALMRWGALSLEFVPVLVTVAALPPMVAFGGSVVLLLARVRADGVARLYAADLVGAGLAAACAVPLLGWIPTPQLAALTGLLPLVAAGIWGGRARPSGARAAALVATAALVGACFVPSLWAVTRSKVYDERQSPPVYEEWTPTARIAVFDETFFYLEGHRRGFTWGRGKYYDSPDTVRQLWLEQDGSAGTPITAFDGRLGPLEFLLYDVSTLGLQLRNPRTVCVIGAGGGRDVLSALVAGADSVDAVDVVEATLRVVGEEFAELSGDLYRRPGITPHAAEGRAFLTSVDRAYDVVQISMADSWAATGAGAYALSENGLYTVEAFELYLQRLTPDGVVAVSRWTKELPWLVALAREALQRSGVVEPERHLAVHRAGRLATLVVSLRPLDEADQTALFNVALDRGFYPLYPVPARRKPVDPGVVDMVVNGIGSLAETGALVSPATDNRPFFFQTLDPFRDIDGQYESLLERTGQSVVIAPTRALRQAMVSTSVAALLLVLVPGAWLTRRRSLAAGSMIQGSMFFAAIGFGFVLVETVLLQRLALFLGHPTRALTVVLAGLLLGMGVGAATSGRWSVRGIARAGWIAPALVAAWALGLPLLSGDLLSWPLPVRIAGTLVDTFLLGVVLGVWFPLGIRRFGADGTPWWWAVNGFLGVVGAVLAVALSVRFGFTVTLWVAVGTYLVAWGAGQGSDGGQTE